MFVYEGTLIWLLNRNNAKGIHFNDRDRLLNINSRSNNISKKYCELYEFWEFFFTKMQLTV